MVVTPVLEGDEETYEMRVVLGHEAFEILHFLVEFQSRTTPKNLHGKELVLILGVLYSI